VRVDRLEPLGDADEFWPTQRLIRMEAHPARTLRRRPHSLAWLYGSTGLSATDLKAAA
jgi:hypothetical protein